MYDELRQRINEIERQKSFFTGNIGGGAGSVLRYFELTTDVTVGDPSTATANLFDYVDETTAKETDADLILNAHMFDDLVTGDCGICGKMGRKWMVFNAPYVPPPTGPVVPTP